MLCPILIMLGWILVVGFLLAVYIATRVLDEYNEYFFVQYFSVCLIVIFGFVIIIQAASVPYYTDKFERAKEYVESYESVNPLEDVSLTNTKIEMNGWLFSAQASNQTFGIFSFFPDSVMDLEPIQ